MKKTLNFQKKGRLGEELAVKYLLGKGFHIVSQNYRIGRYEIDIVASLNNVLYFFEVKASYSQNSYSPIERINHKKLANIYKAAFAYQKRHCFHGSFAIEGISVQVNLDTRKATIERFDLSINGGNL